MGSGTGVTATRVSGWGYCAVAASTAGVCGVVIGVGDRASAEALAGGTLSGRDPDDAFARAGLRVLLNRLAGDGQGAVRLDLAGTGFQRAVWRTLADVDSGETITYADLARRMGRTRASARAVGSAVGANPAPVLIPCHRVLPSTGGIGNYRFGSSLKQRLLDLERD